MIQLKLYSVVLQGFCLKDKKIETQQVRKLKLKKNYKLNRV